MDRRTAISRVALLLGGTIIGADLFISGCTNEHAVSGQTVLSDAQVKYLNEVGETILPKTAASEGAKAANVGLFMRSMVRDCYSKENQHIFFTGLTDLEQLAENTYSTGFLECTAAQRKDLLTGLDKQIKADKKRDELLQQKEVIKEKSSQASGKPNYTKKVLPTPYFTMIKQLTLLGYFTSEIGYKALGYVPVPGRYDGNVMKNSSV